MDKLHLLCLKCAKPIKKLGADGYTCTECNSFFEKNDYLK